MWPEKMWPEKRQVFKDWIIARYPDISVANEEIRSISDASQ